MNNLLVVSLDFFASNPLITLTTALFKIPKKRAMNFFFSDFFLVCRRLQIHYISSLLCFWLHILPFSLFFFFLILILIWRRYCSWTWWRHVQTFFLVCRRLQIHYISLVYLIELDKSLLGNNLGTLVFTFFSDFFLVCRRIQIHYISSLLCFLFHILPFSLFFILILIWLGSWH